ncbi:MAG TPA: 16S rRNA (cytidine(1402)-2'-O)-methyltransferase [Chloroflexota bacterium]|nr:16S rRNA (cytidine(1402)-2'-O)-methyltransferase [Chloroflexota bacterium]
MGTLYLVATPIGNLEDITLRALRILKAVPLVAAEDTRVTRTLFRAHDIHTPLASFHEFTSPSRRGRLIERLAEGDVALVSDAGTPGVSDPGFPLIRDALLAGHTVVPVPGASSVITALVASGLPTHAFCFLGFLPRTAAGRRKLFAHHLDSDMTLIVFESPHRVQKALADMVATLGPDRPIAIGRELTKHFEEVFRGTTAAAQAHFAQHPPRGEFTIVVGGRNAPLAGAEKAE